MAIKTDTMQKSKPRTQMEARREWEIPFATLQREMNRLFDSFLEESICLRGRLSNEE